MAPKKVILKSKKAAKKPMQRTSNRVAVADRNESMRHLVQSRPAENEEKATTILSLNDDCLMEIFSYVGVTDLVFNISASCRRLRTLADDAIREKCRKECFYYFLQDRKDGVIIRRFGAYMREIYANGSNYRSDQHSLAWLTGCSSLESLKLVNMTLKYEWTWECMKILNGLEHLVLERCSSDSIMNASEAIIQSCKKLKSISIMNLLEHTPIESLAHISKLNLKDIERITIKVWGSHSMNRIYTADYGKKLARLTKLKYLHIYLRNMDCERFLRSLSRSKTLEELSLDTNYLNNGLMQTLDTFESLKSCRIHYSYCSDNYYRHHIRHDTTTMEAMIKQFNVVENSNHQCDHYHIYNVTLTRKN